jgi:hypothetical protein
LAAETFSGMANVELWNFVLSFLKKWDWWIKSYREISKDLHWNTNFNFALRASIWRLAGDDNLSVMFDKNWNKIKSEEAWKWKNADDYLKEAWWVNTGDLPKNLVKILQTFVWAKADWLVWPETLYRTAAKLWVKDESLKQSISKKWVNVGDDTVDWYYGAVDSDFDVEEFWGFKFELWNWISLKEKKQNTFTITDGKNDLTYSFDDNSNLKKPTVKENTFRIKYLDDKWKRILFPFSKFNFDNDLWKVKTIRITSIEAQNKKNSIQILNTTYYFDGDKIDVISEGLWVYLVNKITWEKEKVDDASKLKYFSVGSDNVIRLKSQNERLETEREDQLNFLNSIEGMKWHRIAFKVDGKWYYCAYDNWNWGSDYISSYDVVSKKLTRTLNSFSRKVDDKVDVWWPDNHLNLQNHTYKDINNVRNCSVSKESDIDWAVREYTSKGKRIYKNRVLLWEWCKAQSENGWFWYQWWDFLYFCERVAKNCNVNKDLFTYWTWTTLIQAFNGNSLYQSADKIENIVIA